MRAVRRPRRSRGPVAARAGASTGLMPAMPIDTSPLSPVAGAAAGAAARPAASRPGAAESVPAGRDAGAGRGPNRGTGPVAPRQALGVDGAGLSRLQAPAGESGRGEAAPAATARGETPEGEAVRGRGGASAGREDNAPGAPGEKGADGLTKEEQARVRHERAHQAAGGRHAGGANYQYTRGPDGQLYRTSGEVRIDTAPVPDDPQATIDKMRVVRRAALAPAQPSPQDFRVAAEAQQTSQEARTELRAERRQGDGPADTPAPGPAAPQPAAGEDGAEGDANGGARPAEAPGDGAERALASQRAFSAAAARETAPAGPDGPDVGEARQTPVDLRI